MPFKRDSRQPSGAGPITSATGRSMPGPGASSSTKRATHARLLARDGAGPESEPLDNGLTARGDGARGEILNALAELSERQRLVVFLRYYADFDNPTIAHVLAISERTVSATLNQAHPLLQELLEEVSP
jgi:DNA-directed RNA polymerase specialized sigma24 family protein